MASGSAVPGIAIKIGSGTTTSTSTTFAGRSATSTSSEPTPPDTVKDLSDNLYGIYVQAVKGATRQQWVIFPPPLDALGVKNITNPRPVYTYLNRTQAHEGNRAKWFHVRQWDTSVPLSETFSTYAHDGYEISEPVVVKMDVGEYLKVWNDRETPHKYLRTVDKVLGGLGLSIK